VARLLALHRHGEGARILVCLHGVTAFGGHFEGLARSLGPRHTVVAPDLLGHGASPQEPPWSIEEHVGAILATVGEQRGAWLGHSFGARLAFEVAARRPDLVERLVLLEPVLHLHPAAAAFVARSSLAERTYASLEDAVDRRFEESQLHGADRDLVTRELARHLEEHDGRLRYRYQQAAVVTAYSELAAPPPPYDAVATPTLVVLGAQSYLSYDHLVDDHRAALGDLLEVVVVPGGHTLLWDAADETAVVVGAFLDRAGS
jgi:lipase